MYRYIRLSLKINIIFHFHLQWTSENGLKLTELQLPSSHRLHTHRHYTLQSNCNSHVFEKTKNNGRYTDHPLTESLQDSSDQFSSLRSI